MGKGGVSGQVTFPPYMENIHRSFFGLTDGSDHVGAMAHSVFSIIDDRKGKYTSLNPYKTTFSFAAETPYNPSPEVTAVNSKWETYNALLDALDDEEKWQDIVDVVVAKWDATGSLGEINMAAIVADAFNDADNLIENAATKAIQEISTENLEALTAAYEQQVSYNKASALTQFKGMMADANAVHSSAFVIGVALIEAQVLADTDRFSAQLYEGQYRDLVTQYIQAYVTGIQSRLQADTFEKSVRDQLVAQGVQTLGQMFFNRLAEERASSTLRTETQRINALLQREYDAGVIDLQMKAATWDMQVMTFGANMLAAPTGPSVLPEGNSTAASVLGGALGGAAMGLQATGGNPIAGGVGALLGGLAGAF